MAENTTFQATAYTAQGAERESVMLPATLFDGTVNMPVMHQAVKAISIIDTFAFDAPKTKLLVDLITRLGVVDQKVLILTDGVKQNVFLSGRNLPLVHVMPYSDVSTYHILWSDVVLIEASALGSSLEPVAEEEVEGEGEAEKPARPKRSADAARGTRKAASK